MDSPEDGNHQLMSSALLTLQKPMKTTLVTVLTVAFLATTAKAGLGWTLEECIRQYGQPGYTTLDLFTDLRSYHFKAKDFEIAAILNSVGKVAEVIYFSQPMSEQDIGNLLADNAPKAEWRKHVKDGETLWEGFEDGSRKYSAYSWIINDANSNADICGIQVLEIGTVEFEDLKKECSERKVKALQER
jgi:hypothetical protein